MSEDDEHLQWTSIVANPAMVDRDKLATALTSDGSDLDALLELRRAATAATAEKEEEESSSRKQQTGESKRGGGDDNGNNNGNNNVPLESPAASERSEWRVASPPAQALDHPSTVASADAHAWFRPMRPETESFGFPPPPATHLAPPRKHESSAKEGSGAERGVERGAERGVDGSAPPPDASLPPATQQQPMPPLPLPPSSKPPPPPPPPPTTSFADADPSKRVTPEEAARRDREMEQREKAEIKRQIRMYERVGFNCSDFDEWANIHDQREMLEMVKGEFDMKSTINWVKDGINLLAGLAELVYTWSLCPKWMKLKGLAAAIDQTLVQQELTLQQIYFQYKRHMEISPVYKFGTGVLTTVVGVQVVNMVAESRVLKHPVVDCIGKMFGVSEDGGAAAAGEREEDTSDRHTTHSQEPPSAGGGYPPPVNRANPDVNASATAQRIREEDVPRVHVPQTFTTHTSPLRAPLSAMEEMSNNTSNVPNKERLLARQVSSFFPPFPPRHAKSADGNVVVTDV